jgi:hypothetical protein
MPLMGVVPRSIVHRIPPQLRERLAGFSCGLPSLFERLGTRTPHRKTDFPTFDGGADLDEFAPDRGGPFLKNGRNITPLAEDRDNDDLLFIQRLVNEIMLTDGVQQQRGSAGEIMPAAQGRVMFRDVLRAIMQVVKISIREILSPPRPRPSARFAQIAGGPIRQYVALVRHSASIVILEIENRSGKEPALFEVVKAFEDVERNGPVLHILAYQIADVFAGRGIDIVVARSFIHILTQGIGQLNV